MLFLTAPQFPGRSKRSSLNRPVLQLQVKPDTLERVRHRTSSSLMASRGGVRSMVTGDSAYGKCTTHSERLRILALEGQ